MVFMLLRVGYIGFYMGKVVGGCWYEMFEMMTGTEDALTVKSNKFNFGLIFDNDTEWCRRQEWYILIQFFMLNLIIVLVLSVVLQVGVLTDSWSYVLPFESMQYLVEKCPLRMQSSEIISCCFARLHIHTHPSSSMPVMFLFINYAQYT